jgi:hypothetical protein
MPTLNPVNVPTETAPQVHWPGADSGKSQSGSASAPSQSGPARPALKKGGKSLKDLVKATMHKDDKELEGKFPKQVIEALRRRRENFQMVRAGLFPTITLRDHLVTMMLAFKRRALHLIGDGVIS